MNKPAPFSTSATRALEAIRHFLPRGQYMALGNLIRQSEEREHYQRLVISTHEGIASMPATYDQDGKGDQSVAHLHYTHGGFDFYVTEKDMEGIGTEQVFGLVSMPPNYPEVGYFNLGEIVAAGAELDLHWTPKTIAECERAAVA